MEKERTVQPKREVPGNKEPTENLSIYKYAEETVTALEKLKAKIDHAQAICEYETIGGKETLTVRDVRTKEILFFTDNQEQIDFLMNGVMTG